MIKNLGLHKSPLDERDHLITNYFKDDKKLPSRFDLTNKMTRVRNQGPEGSCAGQAGDGVKEFQEWINGGKVVYLSPRYIYEYAKEISGHSEGTTLIAICKVLKDRGICFEKDWPYIANEVNSPAPIADSNASMHKIKSYARITGLTELKRTVFEPYPAGGATMIGIKVYKGMVSQECKQSGIVPDPTCWDRLNVLGGHAVVVVGWDDNSVFYKGDGHVKFKNSWGDWGHEGYGYLSYKYIKNQMLDAVAMPDIEAPINPITVAHLSMADRDRLWV